MTERRMLQKLDSPLRDMASSVIWERLRVSASPHVKHPVEVVHLVNISPGHLSGEEFQTCPTRWMDGWMLDGGMEDGWRDAG